MAVLRASAEQAGEELDYAAVTAGAAAGDTGVPEGGRLIELAEAILDSDGDRLAEARRRVADALGAEALVDAVGVAAFFNAIDRVADATGTPVEDWKLAETAEIAERIGIGEFAAAKEALEA